MINLEDVFSGAKSSENTASTKKILEQLPADRWTEVVTDNLDSDRADIRAILYYLATTMRPVNYLEIGVRTGWSMAMVAAGHPECDIFGFDLWINRYASADNPGPLVVEETISKISTSKPKLITGDSHRTVPQFFIDYHASFDLMLVDGDHSVQGEILDVMNCLPRLAHNGILILDDLRLDAWRYIKAQYPEFEYATREEIGLIRRAN